MKTAFFAAILAAAPFAASAQGCSYGATASAAITCAPGTVLDAETNVCVAEIVG